MHTSCGKSLFQHVRHMSVTYPLNTFPYSKEDAAFRNMFHEPWQYHSEYKIPIIMPVNKPGFKITTYCGCVPLSCLFGNWIQSPLSAGSTSSLAVVALNRQRQQKNVSILLILRSCFIISAQLMVLDCGCFFFFFCVSFQPTFKSQKKEKDIQHRWEEDDFFFFPPFFPSAYLLRGVGEYVVIFSPTRNGKLLKGEDERREMACYKGTGTDRQHEPMRWQTWRVFEVFCPFFVLGHAWAKKIWGKWRELRGGKGGEACQTQALTGCLMCFMQVLYSGETDSGKKHCFLKTLHVCLAPNNRISND